jgi:hypothetical protein
MTRLPLVSRSRNRGTVTPWFLSVFLVRPQGERQCLDMARIKRWQAMSNRVKRDGPTFEGFRQTAVQTWYRLGYSEENLELKVRKENDRKLDTHTVNMISILLYHTYSKFVSCANITSLRHFSPTASILPD